MSLKTCPDCGGILEPVRRGWIANLEFAATAEPAEVDPVQWRCLLCGYVERDPLDLNRAIDHL